MCCVSIFKICTVFPGVLSHIHFFQLEIYRGYPLQLPNSDNSKLTHSLSIRGKSKMEVVVIMSRALKLSFHCILFFIIQSTLFLPTLDTTTKLPIMTI